MRTAECHPESKHYAKGMCATCYQRSRITPERRERNRLYMRKWRQNPENAEKNRRLLQEWADAHPEKVRETKVRNRLKQRFGLTPEDYDEMLLAQGGKCAICGREPTSGTGLTVDHDHTTGAVRALLCRLCNTMLGHGGDDPLRLRAGAAYLERFAC